MRDFTFYTSRPMLLTDCYNDIKKEIKHVGRTKPSSEFQQCSMTKGEWRWYLWFYNERFDDYVDFYEPEEFEAEKSLIPIKDPYLNHFESYRSDEVKSVLKVLMQIYPELYVSADEDDPEWYGTAQEYIDTEFDY